MDKFGALVMEAANFATSSALTPAQKTLIQNRLAGFFSDFRTPDHPPYAAMIHRAIRELNELGGSSEESISKFMKEEYHELPWAHFTLLKHHLGELCECGEIVVTHSQRYLLAGANPNLNSSTGTTRDHLKRKRKWGWKRGRSRRRKKDEIEEEQRIKEHLKVIDQQNQLNAGQNEVIGKWNQPNSEKVDLVEEQNHLLKLPDEMIEEEIQADEQQKKVIENEPHEQENKLVDGENKQNKQESRVAEEQEQQNNVTEKQNKPKVRHLEVIDEQLEENQLELSSPERPPGFDIVTVDELSQSEEQRMKVFDLCKPLGLLPSMTAFLDLPIDSLRLDQELNIKVSNPKRPPKLDLSASVELSQDDKQQVVPSSDCDLLKQHESQSKARATPSDLTAAMMDLLPLQHQPQQPELSNSEGLQQESAKLEELFEAREVQAEQHGRCKLRKPKSKEIASKDVSINSEPIKQKKLPEFPNPDKSLGLKLTTFDPLSQEQQQQVEIFGEQEALEKKLPEFPNPDESLGLKLTTFDPLTQEQQQQVEIFGEQEALESQSGTMISTFNLPEDEKQLIQEELPALSVQERPIELEPVTIEESAQTQRLRRQMRRWSRRIKPKLAAASTVELLSSSQSDDHHPLQPELSDLERPQELNSSPIEGLTQVMDQRAKLRSWQMRNTSQTKTTMTSVDSSLASQQLEAEQPPQPPCAERSPELEALKELSQQLQLAAQEKPPRRILRPQLPEPESATSACMAELSSQHQHKEEQQTEHRGRGRPRKAKSNTTAVESTLSDHQNQHEQKHPGHRGCGKPQKGKLEDAKTEEISSISPRNPQKELQQQQGEQPKHRGRGRPPKGILKAASTEDILPNVSQNTQKEPQQQQEEQPQHRGRGRPPKGKFEAATIDEILSPKQESHQQQEKLRKNEGHGRQPTEPKPAGLPSAKQQEQRKKQGRGRPRKVEQGK